MGKKKRKPYQITRKAPAVSPPVRPASVAGEELQRPGGGTLNFGDDVGRLPNMLPDVGHDLFPEKTRIDKVVERTVSSTLTPGLVPERDVPPFNPLDVKARVVSDLRTGHFDNPVRNRTDLIEWTKATMRQIETATLVDAQAVFDRWMKGSTGSDLYSLRLAPPWENGVLVYNTPTGNVWAMHMISYDIQSGVFTAKELDELTWQPDPPADHTIDWDRVRWIYGVRVYVGGMGFDHDTHVHRQVETTGPIMLWRVAVYEDGEPADMHWTQLVTEIPFSKFNNALGVLTETVNMLNCVNVQLAFPTRSMSRPQRRRLERLGVRFSEIHVLPTSKSYRGKGQALADMEMPIHGVRGHYSTYGAEGRGLLFGKYAGRFWIPPHVRGSREAGEVTQSYQVEQ